MKPELDFYDWAEVFGEGSGGNCTPIIPNRQPPTSDISVATFSREDVVEIIGMEEGERDGDTWIIYGKLQDDRYFIARGWCDYTGWDCRASNSGDVANTLPDLIRYGMSDDERSRFKVSL